MQALTLRAGKRQLVLVLFALAISAVTLGVVGTSKPADASSHREAPYISGDPQADATDVYAFRSPDRPNSVTTGIRAFRSACRKFTRLALRPFALAVRM